MTAARTLLRDRGSHESGRVAMVELFFDLVFVFAITQLSHTLLGHLTPSGALRTLLLFLAVWWLWIYTSWVTNWLDPDKAPVRLMLFALMLGGLVLSAALPHAFEAQGLLFGAVFAAMQLGRTAFMVWAMRGEGRAVLRLNFVRIGVWLAVSAVFWVGGGLHAGDARLGWWIVALAIEYLGPVFYFRVPGLGASSTTDWDVDGSHLSERCALFVIIALGESILVTGATSADLPITAETLTAFVVAFAGSVAMWWVYFDTGADRAAKRITKSDDPGRVARIAYTYLHLPIVAGIVVGAVADELMLTHPGHLDGAGMLTIVGGPLLYLTGNALFKWVTNDRRLPPISHLAGLALLLALLPAAPAFSALALGTATTAILMLVAGWESIALRRANVRPT